MQTVYARHTLTAITVHLEHPIWNSFGRPATAELASRKTGTLRLESADHGRTRPRPATSRPPAMPSRPFEVFTGDLARGCAQRAASNVRKPIQLELILLYLASPHLLHLFQFKSTGFLDFREPEYER